GTLEGTATATTDADGAAFFGDLGIDGTGSHTLQFTAGSITVTSDPVTLTALPAEATTGKWDAPVQWDIVPLHMSMLPTGKIIAWGKFETDGMMGQPRLWDPSQGGPAGAPTVANDTMLFCAGHTLMADGRLMVSGGHKEDDRGLDVTNIFDPASETWVPGLPKMAKGRWYPTVTTLPDGRVVTIAGKDTTKTVVRVPEIWEGNQWVQLPGANLELPYYPRDFVDPKSGRVFYAGERISSLWLDVDGSSAGGRGRWIDGPDHIYKFNRDYGSAAMYDTGKILYVGGGGDPGWDTPDPRANVPTATAEKIDLTATSPTWQDAGSMAARRRHLNATVLPDGTVLVTGGISGGGELNDVNTPVKAAELWDPATNDWTTLASQQVTRAYHSVSLLMLDGTVLSGASGDAFVPGTGQPYPAERNHEIFHPPYLFKGSRPTIADVPSEVSYGQTFTVTTPNAAQIAAVRWIRLPSVTHAFDANGRANTLSFTRVTSGVQVEAPANANLAPPGHYVLYILNRNGVPSTGEIIRIH
ncbi:MAG TPA: galactose oxidase-like domain-containing protein, partial [Gemmatimonadales bacterium]|nr:galactose oxidase-like domain-containing protein [Gemmatimonadales bacterium]